MKISHKIMIFGMAAFLLGAPLTPATAALVESESLTAGVAETSVSVAGKELRVQNAEGSILKIFNVTGAQVATYRIDSNDKTIVLTLQRGCYILNIGKFTRKISIH